MDVTPVIKVRDGDKVWARLQYEKFNMSSQDIAKFVNRTQTQVVSWASNEGWVRNKSTAEDKERIALMSEEQARRSLDALLIERVNVEMQAKVLVEHRKDIKAMRSVAADLWEELKNTSGDLDERITMFKKLSEASKNVILLERQAHGIEGALIEPTNQESQGTNLTTGESAMASLLGKFASVLGKAQSTPLATEVVDVSPRA